MSAPLLGIIRVLTTTDRTLLDAHGDLLRREFGMRTTSRCIADQPHGVHDAASARSAVPKIVATAAELRSAGATAMLISCAADPGLDQTRLAVDAPVFGAGSAAASAAAALGMRVGVLGITAEAPEPVRRVLGDRLVAHERPAGVTKTTDLLTDTGRSSALESVSALVAEGAEVVLFACTGLTSIGLAADVRWRYGLPVVDAVRAAGAVAGAAL